MHVFMVGRIGVLLLCWTALTPVLSAKRQRVEPTYKWAQRFDRIYVTIDSGLVTDEWIMFDSQSMELKLKNDTHIAELDLDFFGEVDGEHSNYVLADPYTRLEIMKARKDRHWPRLLEDTEVPDNQKVDEELWLTPEGEERMIEEQNRWKQELNRPSWTTRVKNFIASNPTLTAALTAGLLTLAFQCRSLLFKRNKLNRAQRRALQKTQ